MLGAFFLLPSTFRYLKKKYGTKLIAFSVTPALALLIVLYVLLAVRYYYTQVHPFDPFLQIAPPELTSHTSDAPDSSLRILALGGSTTANLHLPPDKRYPSVLEQLLHRAYPTLNIEVFNGGMDWYTSKHSLITYVTEMREWNPDIVIVMHAINDLYRSFSDPDYALGPYNHLWSHYYGPSINGAVPPTFEQHILSPYNGTWFSTLRYKEEDMPVERYVSLNDFKRNLASLVHYLKKDQVTVILMTQPSLYKDTMSPEERAVLWFGRIACKEQRGILRYAYPSPRSLAGAMRAFNNATTELARSAGVLHVDLAAQIPKDLTAFVDDVHYTEKGSASVAQIVSEAIINNDLANRARRSPVRGERP